MKVLFMLLVLMPCGAVLAQVDRDQLDEDEAGLWMLVDRHEQMLRTSSRLIDDPGLRAHLQRMACNLSARACDEVRVYPLRAPGFNAFMMPNGAMGVQSGLLLRVHNEAELAAVIGHEISHYYRDHSVQRMRRWRNTQSGFAVAGALLSAASNVSINSATSYSDASRALELSQTASLMLQTAGIVAAFQLLAYDRGQEAEADIDGLGWLHEANYDKFAAPRVWNRLIAEQVAGGNEAGFSLLSTHPAPADRMSYLKEEAKKLPDTRLAMSGGALFAMLEQYRRGWMTDELMALMPEQFEFVCRDQVELGLEPGYAQYLAAESWIRHSKKERGRKQREALERADTLLAEGEQQRGLTYPPETYREWARVNLELADQDAAIGHFAEYIRLAPDAWDRKFVEKQVAELQAGS